MLQRLKTTLTSSGAALLMSSVLLFGLIRAGSDADGMYGERVCVSCMVSVYGWHSPYRARTGLGECCITSAVGSTACQQRMVFTFNAPLQSSRGRPWCSHTPLAQCQRHRVLSHGAGPV